MYSSYVRVYTYTHSYRMYVHAYICMYVHTVWLEIFERQKKSLRMAALKLKMGEVRVSKPHN